MGGSESADFEVIGNSEDRMFGPRAFIACGFTVAEQSAFLRVLKDAGVDAVPVCFASRKDKDQTLGALAGRPLSSGLDVASDLDRAVVLSGATEAELHRVMGAYRARQLPRPLWATLTETSVDWPLSELLLELAAERSAMEG